MKEFYIMKEIIDLIKSEIKSMKNIVIEKTGLNPNDWYIDDEEVVFEQGYIRGLEVILNHIKEKYAYERALEEINDFNKINKHIKKNMLKVSNHFDNLEKDLSKDLKKEDLKKFNWKTIHKKIDKLNNTQQYYYLLGLNNGIQMCNESSKRLIKLINSSLELIKGVK
jgi:hypothetical protein